MQTSKNDWPAFDLKFGGNVGDLSACASAEGILLVLAILQGGAALLFRLALDRGGLIAALLATILLTGFSLLALPLLKAPRGHVQIS